MAERISVFDLEGTLCLHGGSVIQVSVKGSDFLIVGGANIGSNLPALK